MITRVGVVGPRDSVELICTVGKEFENQIVILPFVYQHTEETAQIVVQAEQDVDVWLFSGMAPHGIAKNLVKQKAFYPQLNGSILTKVLLEIVFRDQLQLERVSFDTFSERDFLETIEELGLTCSDPLLFPLSGYRPASELIAFHTSLYKEGKTVACATGLRSVYEELKAQGIPVYRISFNRMTIREMFKQACQEGETLHFKRSQIAVQLIQIDELEKYASQSKNAYDLRRLDLKLQELILDYTERLSGSFVALGNGSFLLFSTRGSFEDTPYHPASLLEKITLLAESPANMGIGFGATALAAERNAQLALHHAKKLPGCTAILVNDIGTIEGPLQQPDSISFEYRTQNKEIIEVLKKAGVTISTLNKLISVQKNIGQNSISAADVAEWLGMTERNARRILGDLAECGLAEIIGEEAPASRGRPRKIYRIKA